MNSFRVFIGAPLIVLQASSFAFAASDPVVRLPKVIVEERSLIEAEHWRYARQGSFEIISQTKDDTIRQLAQGLELIPVIVKTIWPAPNLVEQTPAEIILCDSEKTFGRFVPLEVSRAVDAARVDRLFLKDRQREVIVLKCEKIDDADRFRDILRDYARRCLLSLKQPPPDWFVTGMAEVISDADYHVVGGKLQIQYARLDKTTIRAPGQKMPPSLYDTEKPSAAVLDVIHGSFDNHAAYEMISDDATLPDVVTHERFNTYFATNRYHPRLEDVLRHSASVNRDDYRMTCWAFVHLCAFAQKRGYSRPLGTLLRLAGENPQGDIVAMFRQAFAQSPDSLDTTVSNYSTAAMSHGVKKEIELKAMSPLVIAEATPQQIGRLKGDAYQLAGHRDEAAAEAARVGQASLGQ